MENRFLQNKTIKENDFDKEYSTHKLDKYKKNKAADSVKGFGYWILLIILFIVAYFLFSEFMFPEK